MKQLLVGISIVIFFILTACNRELKRDMVFERRSDSLLKVLSGNQIKEPVQLYKLKPDAWDNIIIAHPYMQEKQLKALPISNGNQLAEATKELRNSDFYSIFIFTKAGKAISYSRVSREVQYEILQGKTLILSRSKAVFLYSDRQLRLQ